MKQKGYIVFICSIVSLLCGLFLSFTFFTQKIENQAAQYATEKGATAYDRYLDSVWNEPVVDLFGMEFTYGELKEKELSLGLDLQGGMHVILEVSAVDFVRALADQTRDDIFLKALDNTEDQSPALEDFAGLFAKELKNLQPEKSLSHYFSNQQNQDEISILSEDQEVIAFIQSELNQAVERSFEILRNRVDQFGVANPNLQRLPGTNRIQIELAGVDDPERVRKLLQGMANLEFWEVWSFGEIEQFLHMANNEWLKTQQAPEKELSDLVGGFEEKSDTTAFLSKNAPFIELMKPGYRMIYHLQDTSEINAFLNDPNIERLIPSDLIFMWAFKPELTESGPELELYPLKIARGSGAALKGNIIRGAQQEFEDNGPSVTLSMNAEGARRWARLTEQNIGRQVAIVLDGLVYTAPVVQEQIPNGQSSISGNFTLDEAQDLANILKTGKLPAKIKIVEEAVVGPTLGQAAVSQGLVSLLASIGLIVLFMMMYYGKGGTVANLAVLINIAWIMGVLAQLGSTLTLPGVAGLVLTIGMAVDANVLIFERVREELSKGRKLYESIQTGYSKAYSSILDANITTFLTGWILYIFGTGAVKGFAVVLMIGVVCSVLSAVFITRMILEWLYKHNKLKESSFNTFISRKLRFNFNYDFVRVRKRAYLFSTIIILLGVTAFIVQKGYHLGVDFKGGRSYIVAFDKVPVAAQVKEALGNKLGDGSLEVKTFNNDSILKITTSYLINSGDDDVDQKLHSLISTALTGIDDYHPTIIGSAKVGPSVADDFREAAFKTVIFSLIVIFLYILLRFNKWQYGLAALVALIHDVLMIFAIYATIGLFNIKLEIDQVFIAAVLTIVGYSINDTVVVFDRIREFSGKLRTKQNFREALNPAINNTLSRTLITSLTVLIVVVTLLVFGGEVLRGFSVALLTGVIFGTYSSIFVAATLALDFHGNPKSHRAKRLAPGTPDTATNQDTRLSA